MLGSKEEDRFTQYFTELLQARSVLEAFLRHVCDITGVLGEHLSARVQFTVDGGRPDIAVRDDSLYLLFEAKVASWLRKDQLRPYAHALEEWRKANPDGSAALFVIAPERQLAGMLHTAEKELTDCGMTDS